MSTTHYRFRVTFNAIDGKAQITGHANFSMKQDAIDEAKRLAAKYAVAVHVLDIMAGNGRKGIDARFAPDGREMNDAEFREWSIGYHRPHVKRDPIYG